MLRSRLLLSTLVVLVASNSLLAANITWIGGNGIWSEGAPNNVNWNPGDEPDPDDVAIFNASNGVQLGTNNTVSGLTLSGDAGLRTDNYALTVNGPTTISGTGTKLTIDGPLAQFTGQNVTVNSGAQFFMNGGTANIGISGAPNAAITVNNGGLFTGNGTVIFDDIPAGPTTVFTNAGTLTASNPPSHPILPPTPSSLTLDAWSANARIDLDGFADNGVVNVTRNQTLNVNITLADPFNSKMNLGHNATINIKNPWTFSGSGAILVKNGEVLGLPGIAAGTSTIGGGTMNQIGGTVTVEDLDGTLQFNAPLNMTGGSLINNGLVVFNADATIGPGATVTSATDSSSLTVKAGRNAQFIQQQFKLGLNGAATNYITVENGGRLGLDLSAVAAHSLTGTIRLHGGELNVVTGNDLWSIKGLLTVAADETASTISGEVVTFDLADVAVLPGAHLNVTSTSHWEAGTNVSVGEGAKLTLATTTFKGPSITGGGELALTHGSSVHSSTTIEVSKFDWDGATAGHSHTIANGVLFAIEAATFDDDADMDDNVTISGNGAALIVNSEPKWTMRGTLNTNLFAAGTATIGGTSTMALGSTGVMNVNGNTNLAARVAFEADSTTTIASTAKLALQGGTDEAPNVIAGGSINGTGTLAIDPARILRGHGTIGANIVNASEGLLLAAGGELKVNGAINDLGVIGTDDATGILNVTKVWSSSVAVDVRLAGGELKGEHVTVANATGIRGKGLVSARLTNNTRLEADAGTLAFKTVNNDNDWDGLFNNGALSAINGATLELHDTSQFNFFGTASATDGSRIRAKDFNLNLGEASTLHLSGSTFEAQRGTNVAGKVIVGSGATSTIEVASNYLLTIEDSSEFTLDGDLRLLNNNVKIEAGAAFAGAGALVIPNGSNLVADADADVDVLLSVQGSFRPAGYDAPGRVDVKDYQQVSTGKLFVDLVGTSLNQFDRILVDGIAQIDGKLNLDVKGGFIPAVGDTFSFLTASNGVFGAFDSIDVNGMPTGLAFHVNYLANAVQLQVVNEPTFAADFDHDGDVDETDLGHWKGAFGLNHLGDANGDNITDGSDFLIWQRQFGSKPAAPVAQPAAGAVPEPATGALLLLASTALFAIRRRA